MQAVTMRRRSLLGAVIVFAASVPARAAIPSLPRALRRLKLYNAHTRETFEGPYSTGDGVIASAAVELSHFLRDFHSGVTVAMDMRVIDFLCDVLDAVGAGGATVLSAYRTPETNAALARTTFGVAEHSQHMYARAIDFTIGSKLAEAAAAARSMRRGGVGWYPHSHFIHIDTGPVRNWSLGDENLQRLLTGPEDELRNAAGAGRGARPASAAGKIRTDMSPYAGSDTKNDLLRPSQYGSRGIREQLIRPSQYRNAL